jgi:hypothetical protein
MGHALLWRVIKPALLFFLFLSLPCFPGFSLPMGADGALARLKQDLARGPSATEVLSHWCGDLHFADPPQIHAKQMHVLHPADAKVRALLKVSARERIGYRRVRLTCGGHVLSEADNWYVPGRLTPAMNRTLGTTDTPFGTVVKPLDFHRVTLRAQPFQQGRTMFQVQAVLLTPEDRPISLVVENYQRDLLGR